MAFPNIGLRAILEITDYSANARKYISLTRDIDRATQRTTRNVNQATRGMAASVVRSFTEFSRQSSIVQDAFDNLRPDAAIAEFQRLNQAFLELGDKARVNVGVFDQLVNAGVGFADAMRVAGGAVQFNIDTFDRLIQKGVDVETAFRQASGSANAASQSINLLGRQFTTTAVAASAITTALAASVQLVRQSISEYTELAEATRRLRAETGLLAEEASGWVQVAQASGVSANTASRGMAQFLGRVSDLRREQQLGIESTSDFSRALDFLDVSIEDGEGNLKTTEELLSDVNRAFQDLGPGIQTAGAATDLFGRTGRQLLPILTDTNTTLEQYQSTLDRFGARLSALDKQEHEQFLQSQFELQAALQGVFNHIARNWIPVLSGVADVVSEVIGIYNIFVSELFGSEFAVNSLSELLRIHADNLAKVGIVLRIVIRGYKDIISNINPLLGLYSRLAAEEEAVAQARAQAAQAAAEQIEIERRRQEAIKDTVEQLDELRTQLVEKLEGIERDAAQKWEDIFVNRQREAIDRARQETFRLIDLQAAYNDRLDAIEADFAKRWDDILVKRQREAIVRGIRLAQRYEDLARAAEQRRQDTLRDFADREVELRRDTQKRIDDAERNAQRKREELERDHRRRLEDIRLQFLDTATEAARRNDAVAVARAQRQRARDLRDEQRRFVDEQRDLEDALKQKRDAIQRDRLEREQDHRDELARALQRIDENYARQRQQLVEQNARERELRELQYQWELDDFEAARAEQLQAAEDWFKEQEAALLLAQAREALVRDENYKRQEADFNKARQRQLDDAIEWYEKERDELAAHLSLTGQQLEAIYDEWAREAAMAVAEVARAAADALASEITRYQHLLTEAQRARARAQLPVAGAPGAPAPPLTTRRNEQGIWVPNLPVLGMQSGGVVQASSPTHVVMGEGGPETGVFLPGRPSSLSVNHSFGRLGVDFQGLPGGMNTQQVENIVYAVVTQIAKGIQVPRN